MAQIHIVTASHGDYSDRVERTVVAYTKEKDARWHAGTAKKVSDAWRAKFARAEDGPSARAAHKANVLDPDMSGSAWTETTYYVEAIELNEQAITVPPEITALLQEVTL